MKEVKIAPKEEIEKYVGQIIGSAILIELFGSQANKKTYKKIKRVTNTMKSSLLKRAELICSIKDLGRGQYKIENIKTLQIPAKIQKINNNNSAEKIVLIKLINIIQNNLILETSEQLTCFNGELEKYKSSIDNLSCFILTYKTKMIYNKIKEKLSYLIRQNLKTLEDLMVLKVLKVYYYYNDNNEFVEVSKEIDDKITKKIPNRTINLYNSEHSAFIKTLNIGKVYSMDKISDVNIEKAKEILLLLGECDKEKLDEKLLNEINMDFEYGYCDKIQENAEYYIQKEFKLLSSYVNGDKETVVKLTKEILDEKYRLISSEFLVYLLYLESSKEEFGNGLDDVIGLVREEDLVSVVKDVVAPECHGVYCLIKDGEVVYIGKSNNLKIRERQHSVDENKDYNSVAYIVFKHPEMIHDYERVLIKSIKPKLNKQFLV